MHEVIDDFDPATMKISFLYFGTRERLTVEDTGVGISEADQAIVFEKFRQGGDLYVPLEDAR